MIINILAIFGALFIILVVSYICIELIEDICISNKLKRNVYDRCKYCIDNELGADVLYKVIRLTFNNYPNRYIYQILYSNKENWNAK